MIEGAATRLGNPVDLILLDDGSLLVAEKANGGGQILEFGDFLAATTAGGDLPPTRAVAVGDLEASGTPESLAAYGGT